MEAVTTAMVSPMRNAGESGANEPRRPDQNMAFAFENAFCSTTSLPRPSGKPFAFFVLCQRGYPKAIAEAGRKSTCHVSSPTILDMPLPSGTACANARKLDLLPFFVMQTLIR